MSGAAIYNKPSGNQYLVARRFSFRSTHWCTWLLWRTLSAKSILALSGVSHILHMFFICINSKQISFCTFTANLWNYLKKKKIIRGRGSYMPSDVVSSLVSFPSWIFLSVFSYEPLIFTINVLTHSIETPLTFIFVTLKKERNLSVFSHQIYNWPPVHLAEMQVFIHLQHINT